MNKPTQLNNEKINIDDLKAICQQYIDFIDNDEEYHEDNDYAHYIFENALTAIFGEDVWDFVNNRQD